MTFFSEHGITEEVRDARGYVRFERGDLQKVLPLHQAFRDRPHTARRRMGMAGGYVIPKHPLPAVNGWIHKHHDRTTRIAQQAVHAGRVHIQ